MTESFKRIIAITSFYIIAIGLRYYVTVVMPFEISNLYIQILLRGVGPLLGGLFVIKVLKRPHGLKLFNIGFLRTLLVISVPIILFPLIGIINTGVPYYNVSKYIGVILLYALFEEFGWRNYLQFELIGLNPIVRAVLITVLWYVWHLNFNLSIGNAIFFAILFCGSLGIGHIANKSGSLILVALFHSFFNIYQSQLLSEITSVQKLIVIAISAFVAIVAMKYDVRKKAANKVVA